MYPSSMMMSVAQQRSGEARQRAARIRRIRQVRAMAAEAQPERGRRPVYRRVSGTVQPQV
jgi:hypothetical protein